MGSVVRFALGAALLLTGAPAAMAQYATPPAANQYVQANASTQVAAPNNIPIVEQSPKVHRGGLWCDNTDPYGGHGAKTHWGIRAFWDYMNND